VSQGVDSEYHF